MPSILKIRSRPSTNFPLSKAEMIPSMIPITAAIRVEPRANPKVIGHLAVISLETGVPKRYDFPKSPFVNNC